jgi:hypothetical protein
MKSLNWEQISLKYPRSFEQLTDWYRINHNIEYWADFETRDLYDFFDSLGTHIFIVPELDYERCEMENILTDEMDQCRYLRGFRFEIYQAGNSFYLSPEMFEGTDKRCECESAAFLKAFEITN